MRNVIQGNDLKKKKNSLQLSGPWGNEYDFHKVERLARKGCDLVGGCAFYVVKTVMQISPFFGNLQYKNWSQEGQTLIGCHVIRLYLSNFLMPI